MPKFRKLTIVFIAAVFLVGCSTSAPSEEAQIALETNTVSLPAVAQSAQTASGSEEQFQQADESAAAEQTDMCLECHSSAQHLMDAIDPSAEMQAVSYWDQLVPLEAWEKVYVDKAGIQSTVHGVIACSYCHAGQQSPIKLVAHDGLVKRPTQTEPNVCSECHPNISTIYAGSLHASLEGFKTAIEARSTPEDHPALDEMFSDTCAACHTTCGDCHVSRPSSVGGGLLDGHRFLRTPPMVESCAACHNSTVGDEYLGTHAGLSADVHLVNGNMVCVDCHSGDQMHGQPANCSDCHTSPPGATITPPDHRYAGVQSPSCLSCHAAITIAESDIPIHQVHGAQLACQVCHSIAYTNCEGCHISSTGYPNYRLEESNLAFTLGLNPMRTFTRPYKYVPLRHIPVTEQMYASYGVDQLSNFDDKPTWVYTTPHNIQRYTFQAAGCNYCHGNADLFLTEDKVDPVEIDANQSVIVPQVPASIGSGDSSGE